MADNLPRIAVIGTGGTISSLGDGSLDVLNYPEFGQKLTCEALLERFPETGLVAEPVPITFRQVGSTAIGPSDWLELRALIHRTAGENPGLAGFVIPHGTATLEETAFFLNLTLGINQPVVLVGAQRPASALGTDAGTNLVNALQVAGCPEARGKGVLVVLNNEVHPARDVVKTSTYRVQTFRSFDFGALGHVDGDGPHFYRAPLKAHMPDTPFAGSEIAELPRVDIVYSYAGAEGPTVRWCGRRWGRARAAWCPPGLRRAAPAPISARRSSRPRRPVSSSCNAAAPRAAGSRRAVTCAKSALSPARTFRRKRRASS
jgi:L-asparaginase